ncbi:MAG TPA: hypothetical protein VHB79_25880 [Polyangiaceae bacterium]|nr:hypothetical protein [Polyangiaceae bacterium]
MRFWLGVALASALGAACSSNDAPPPPAADGGSDSSPAGSRSTDSPGGDGAVAQGGARSQAEGGAGEPPIGTIGGAFPGVSEGGAPPNPTPVCNRAARWSGAQALAALNTAQADERLLALSHDELSLVFSRADALFVADRKSAGDDFAATISVQLPAAYTFAQGVALSDDGLTLVVVSQDQHALADVTRTARSKTFDGTADTRRFAWVNANLTQSGLLSSPVLAADGKSLLLTRLEGGDSSVFRVRGDHFDDAAALDAVTLGAVDGNHKLTQSLSADARTLFFFDEGTGSAAALWSSTPAAAYTERVELEGLLSAFTNANCGRLYGTREVEGSLDLVVQTAN